jgi:hypothetical protein
MIVGLLSITVKEGPFHRRSVEVIPRSPKLLKHKKLEAGVRISTSWERY